MDTKFHPAIAAIKSGDLEPNSVVMADVLIDAGPRIS
jgi:hypothetical protein